jgi:hypothetical protein
MLHMWCVGIVMIYLCTAFDMPDYNGSLITVIKQKAKEMLFYI